MGDLIQQADALLVQLHPSMAGASCVQLVSTIVLSVMGCWAIDGRHPQAERTPAEIRAIMDAARRRRR